MAFKISRQGQISGIVTTIRYMLVLWIVLISNYKWSGIIITTMVTELGHTNCKGSDGRQHLKITANCVSKPQFLTGVVK